MSGGDVRVLTVRQPWAGMLVDGSKGAEFRSWATSYRGPLVIHAAARRPTAADLRDAGKDWPWRGGSLGCLLGIVDLVDCKRTRMGDWAWVVENPRRFACPYPLAGKLSLWRIPQSLLDTLVRAGLW